MTSPSERDDVGNLAGLYHDLGESFYCDGELVKAEDVVLEGLKAVAGTPPTAIEAELNDLMALIYLAAGDCASALRHAERTVDLWVSLEQPEDLAVSRRHLAEVLRRVDRLHDALCQERLACRYFEEFGDVADVIESMLEILRTHSLAGDWSQCDSCIEAIRPLASRVTKSTLLSEVQCGIGDSHHHRGDLHSSRAHYESALRILDDVGDSENDELPIVLRRLVGVYEDLGMESLAEEMRQRLSGLGESA